MGILNYENLFPEEPGTTFMPATIPAGTTTIPAPTTIPAGSTSTTSSVRQPDVMERFIEAAVSILVCLVLYLTKYLCRWLLEKLKTFKKPLVNEEEIQKDIVKEPKLIQI
jgi:hypothetical protein